jgi:hypothetical protein
MPEEIITVSWLPGIDPPEGIELHVEILFQFPFWIEINLY